MATPSMSVVIPTRNRCDSVARVLRSLDEDGAAHPVEAVVVDDGSSQNLEDRLSHETFSFPVRVITQPPSGAAAARNNGARAARGDVLLFLDDDLQPGSGLVAAHAAAHASREDVVGIGDLPPVVDAKSLFGLTLLGWWEAMQDDVRRPGHRYTYRDLLSGQFSIRRTQFLALGGFNEKLRAREDYELGWRAISAGLELRFLANAVAGHVDRSDLNKACRRKFEEGIADLYLLRTYPELAGSLPLARTGIRSRLLRLMSRLAWSRPGLGETAVRVLAGALTAYEAIKLRTRWKRVLDGILGYWYWRGVASVAGTRAAFEALRPAIREHGVPDLTIDLAEGWKAAEDRLDALRPRSVRLVIGSCLVGDIQDVPGAEPLRGVHLRPLLATSLRAEYLRALVSAGRAPATLAPLFYAAPSVREPVAAP